MTRRSEQLQGIEPTHGNNSSDSGEDKPEVENRMDTNQFRTTLATNASGKHTTDQRNQQWKKPR